MGKPRETRRDAWDPSPAVARYRGQRDLIKLYLNKIGYGPPDPGEPFNFPTFGLRLWAFIPPPDSWFKKSGEFRKQYREAGRGRPFEPMDSLPDCDNILKGFFDAVFYELRTYDPATGKVTALDDRAISDARITKLWAPRGVAMLTLTRDTRTPDEQLAEFADLFEAVQKFM